MGGVSPTHQVPRVHGLAPHPTQQGEPGGGVWGLQMPGRSSACQTELPTLLLS